MTEHDSDWSSEESLLELLMLLVARGEGTILGLSPRAWTGMVRVSRAQGEQFARRLAEAYGEQFSALVRLAMRKVGDHGRAEDAVQRAFEKLLRRQPDAPEITNLQAYLVTAVGNEVNRELRAVIRQRERDDQTDGAGTATHGDIAAGVAEAMVLRRELERLAPREREAVVIRLQWQLSVEETARVMGLSTGAVKRYTADGVRRLQDRLAAAG